MKLILQWKEGRKDRQTETEIPQHLTWNEVKDFTNSTLKKAYKYSDESLPEGITEGEL